MDAESAKSPAAQNHENQEEEIIMDASPIKAVADWMKTADLAEVVYRKNGTGFSLTALGAGDPAASPPRCS